MPTWHLLAVLLGQRTKVKHKWLRTLSLTLGIGKNSQLVEMALVLRLVSTILSKGNRLCFDTDVKLLGKLTGVVTTMQRSRKHFKLVQLDHQLDWLRYFLVYDI